MPKSYDETHLVETVAPSLSEPIFVTGYMHSGTTLTQTVLGRHEDVFAGGGETRHFTHLPVLKRQFPDLEDDAVLTAYVTYLLQVICTGYGRVHLYGKQNDPLQVIEQCGLTAKDVDALAVEAKHNRDYAMLLGTAYEFLAKKAGKDRWLDKSPDYVAVAQNILSLFPESKMVVLIRDPRDILASKLRRAEKRGFYDPVLDTLAWRAAVRAGERIQSKNPNRIMLVRYEDLVMHPENTVQHICGFLNLEFDKKMVSVDWVNTSTTGLVGTGIGTSAMGKWRSTLPAADVYVCQRLARKEMANNDYLPESVPSTEMLKAPVIYARSISNFLTRLYKQWSVGGSTHFWNVLNNYLIALKNSNKAVDPDTSTVWQSVENKS